MDRILITHVRRSKTDCKRAAVCRDGQQVPSRPARSRSLPAKRKPSSRSPSCDSQKRSHSARPKAAADGGKWDFDRRQLVVTGAFGSTYRCWRRKGPTDLEKIVEKQINLQQLSAKQRKQLIKELGIVQMCQHANLCVPLGVVHGERKVHVYMAYLENRNLACKIATSRQQQSSFDDDVVVAYLEQMLSGVAYLHQHQIVHCNLKPNNMLIGENDALMVADAGMAACLASGGTAAVDMVAYLAPEVLKEQQCLKKSDTWSLGVIGYELTHLCVPYRESNRSRLIEMISEGARQPVSSSVSPALRDLIVTMLHKRLEKRPTCRALLKSKIFQKAPGKKEPKKAPPLPKEPANQHLVIVTCRWKKPVCTYWLEADKRCWRKGHENKLVKRERDYEAESPLIVDERACIIPIAKGGAFLVDSANQRAYRSYDVFSGKWYEIRTGPRIRSNFAVGALSDQRLYLIGVGATSEDANTVQILDLEREKWSYGKPLPAPMFFTAAVVSAGGPVLLGGEFPSSDAHACHDKQHQQQQHRHSKCSHCYAIELDGANQSWKMSRPLMKSEELFISGCEFRGQIAVCLSSGVYSMKRNYPHHQLKYMGPSPGSTESMTAWRSRLVMVRGSSVWLSDPESGELSELPALPFSEFYSRSFALAVNH